MTISADPDPTPPEGSSSTTKTPAAGSGKMPRQLSFLVAAQKVIMQEKLRKDEEQAKAEEFGKWSFALWLIDLKS